MPIEFNEVETDDSSRKRIAFRVLITALVAAVIGALGVWATIAVLNSFASDTVLEIEGDQTCDAFDLVDNIVPPDTTAEPDEITAIHDAFQDEHLRDLGPADGWSGSGITHTDDGPAIVVLVDAEPGNFAYLPDTYQGVPVQVCRAEPFTGN